MHVCNLSAFVWASAVVILSHDSKTAKTQMSALMILISSSIATAHQL